MFNRVQYGRREPGVIKYGLNIFIVVLQGSPEECDHDSSHALPGKIFGTILVPHAYALIDNEGCVIIQHIHVPVLLGHKVVARRVALVVERGVVDSYWGAD